MFINDLILQVANKLGIEVELFYELSPAITEEYMMYKIFDIIFTTLREFGVILFLIFVSIYISLAIDSCSKEHKKIFIDIANKSGLVGSSIIIVSIVGHIGTKLLTPNITLMLEILK